MFITGRERIKQSRHTIRKRGTKSFEDTRKTYVTFVDKILILSFFNLADFLTSIEGSFGGCVYIIRLKRIDYRTFNKHIRRLIREQALTNRIKTKRIDWRYTNFGGKGDTDNFSTSNHCIQNKIVTLKKRTIVTTIGSMTKTELLTSRRDKCRLQTGAQILFTWLVIIIYLIFFSFILLFGVFSNDSYFHTIPSIFLFSLTQLGWI